MLPGDTHRAPQPKKVKEGQGPEPEGGESVLTAICTAMAAGTFLQIATMELIPQVFEIQGNSLCKHVGVIAGFGLMSALAFFD